MSRARMPVASMVSAAARAAGFDAAGIASAGPARHHRRFAAWLQAGRHGGMRYLERHEPMRADPSLWMPGTGSLVVVLLRYPVNPNPGRGGFSSLVWGCDYHDVVCERLRALGRRLREETGAAILRIGCDAVPLAEREWAVRAGLGWIGKQGQLVNPQLGCCVVVGSLLTDLPAPSGKVEIRNRCGGCRRCLDACPTGAIMADGTLDVRRCLAYLTVEHTGPLPRMPANAALYGCDRCTAVCPWNEAAAGLPPPDALSAMPDRLPDAAACLRISDVRFRELFNGTGVRRGGAGRLRRNAAWVLQEQPGRPQGPATKLDNGVNRCTIPRHIDAADRMSGGMHNP